MTPPKRELLVTRLTDREVVHRVDVSGKNEKQVERVLSGMLLRINTDEYFVDDVSK